MILHHAAIQYLVYLQALGLPEKRLQAFKRVLKDIEVFYGPGIPLEEFDNSLALDYVAINDPFDTDPVSVERGCIFCKFTHWLMKNHLIPAWADEMQEIEKEGAHSFYSLGDYHII